MRVALYNGADHLYMMTMRIIIIVKTSACYCSGRVPKKKSAYLDLSRPRCGGVLLPILRGV